MIQGVIFDMDGLLVDSEPWWREAERIVFGRLSKVPEPVDFERMMGNRIQDVISQWHARYPWQGKSFDEVQQAIVDQVLHLVTTHAELMPGVLRILNKLAQKKIPIALASSSPYRLIQGLMEHYGIYKRFQIICSAEYEKYGKPHPAVFLKAAQVLNLHPKNLLVFEDSFNGVIAAKAAGMLCVAIPAKEHRNQSRFKAADLVLNALEDFTDTNWNALQATIN
jgi:sugar-phosphatase